MKTRMVHRSDENQRVIVEALRSIGANVEILGGKGIPDLLVGYLGANYLLEVKHRRSKLNNDQARWHGLWGGQVAIVRNIADAFRVIGLPGSDSPISDFELREGENL